MRRILLLVATLLGTADLTEARATDVYAVSGTLGYDLLIDALPVVDFAVGDECIYQELDLSDLIELVREGGAAAVDLAPGAYEAALLEAGDSCGGVPLATGRVDVPASPLPGRPDDAAVLVAAELDASGAPKVASFTVNTSAIGNRRSRVTFFHMAEAPALDLQLQRRGTNVFATIGLENGDQTFPSEVLGRDYELLISATPLAGGEFDRAVASFRLVLQGDRSHAVVLVGSLPDKTLDVLTLELPTAP